MITYSELKKIAALAKLSLEGEDAVALTKDISGIIEFADTIAKAAADIAVAPGAPLYLAERPSPPLREDVPQPSWPRMEILANAAEQKDGFFVTRGKGGHGYT